MPSPVVGFDLDLTLVDTRARILFAAMAGFADLGVEVGEADLVPLLGFPLAHKAAQLAPRLDPEAFTRQYRLHYRSDRAPSCPAAPGAAAALDAVRDLGGRCVVVSAKAEFLVHEALAHAGLAKAVDAVHGGVFAEGKAPALREEGAHVYVGDHPGDVVAARVAGCAAVAVATGATEADGLRSAGADVVLRTLEEFPAWYRTRVR
ncbi:HAD family hydrolase [Segniliparus rugosus]|nr:HAD hydrolase-like protein [Segniliparus rugosus]